MRLPFQVSPRRVGPETTCSGAHLSAPRATRGVRGGTDRSRVQGRILGFGVACVFWVVLAGCSGPSPQGTAAVAELGFLKGFTVEDAAVRMDQGQPVLYVLMSSKTAALQNTALAAGSELKGASVYVNDTKTLYWYRVAQQGRRLGAMVFHGSPDRETVVEAQAANEPTDTVKCLLSFGPALATPPARKP